MNASSQRFDSLASNYATSEVHTSSPTRDRLHALLLARVESVCDVASGAGHTGLGFAGVAPRIVAVDPAPNMLAQARRLAAERGVIIETLEAFAESIPLPSTSFDLVVCRIAAHNFFDLPKATAEMTRLVRAGRSDTDRWEILLRRKVRQAEKIVRLFTVCLRGGITVPHDHGDGLFIAVNTEGIGSLIREFDEPILRNRPSTSIWVNTIEGHDMRIIGPLENSEDLEGGMHRSSERREDWRLGPHPSCRLPSYPQRGNRPLEDMILNWIILPFGDYLLGHLAQRQASIDNVGVDRDGKRPVRLCVIARHRVFARTVTLARLEM